MGGEDTNAPTGRILVVDDDEGLLVLMASVLQEEGHEVETAGSAAAALQRLVVAPPDLMLLDLKLQDLGGPALVRHLQDGRVTPVPFVVVTGQGDEKVAVEVLKQGALDYVMKNTALLDLLPGVVRRALGTIEQQRALAAAQAELRASVERFAAAVRATNDGVWEWQLQEQRFYFSDRWKNILGYRSDELPDEHATWVDRVHPEDRERLKKAQEQGRAGVVDSFRLEYRMRHRDGGYRWVLCRATVSRGDDGRPLRLTGAHTDITENKQLEQEILAISEREQRRIGQDLHDGLGQQLTALELMCHMVRSDLEAVQPEAAADLARMGGFLREAVAQTRSLAHGLTAFMLDASGLQAALAALAGQATATGRLRCRFEGPAAVQLDGSVGAGHLYRIAQEAVNNALKHSGAREVVITLEDKGGVVTLTIADNGRGLPAVGAGHGIGLRVMQHRANAIGAELNVLSPPGGGLKIVCALRR